jgi:hypothetical protein
VCAKKWLKPQPDDNSGAQLALWEKLSDNIQSLFVIDLHTVTVTLPDWHASFTVIK